MADGDRVLLISTAAVQVLDDEIIAGILKLPEEQVLADLYHRLNHLRHLTAVLVTTAAAETSAPIRASAHPDDDGEVIDATGLQAHRGGGGPSYQPSLFIEDEGAEAIEEARRHLLELRPRRRVETELAGDGSVAPMPLRRASGETVLAALAAESEARAARSREAVNALAAAIGARPAWDDGRSNGAVALAEGPHGNGDALRSRNHSFSRSLLRDEVRLNPSPITTDAPPCDELAEDARARAAFVVGAPVSLTIAGEAQPMNGGGSLVRMRGDMGGRWRGGGGRSAQVAGQFPPTWLVIVVGLLLLVGLVAVMVGPRALGGDDSERYASLVDQARQQLAAARALPDPAAQRDALTNAQAMLLEAREIDAAALEGTGLVAEVEGEIAAMDNVREPQAVEKIASLEQFGEQPVSVLRLVVGPNSAYLLDSAGAQVIAVPFADGDRHVLYAANGEGERGAPIALAFLDDSAFAGMALVIADDEGRLWAVATEGPQPLEFAAPDGLAITDIATYEGDLYVLDASASVVYRFEQGPTGYATPPTKLLDTPELAAARRIMMDGEVVTADADGTLHRFTNQVALELSQAGIDQPLVKDDLVQPVTERGDLAVLDAPNDRLVVFRRDGTFDRQYQHKDMTSMTAFAIRDGVAYVFAGGWLRRVVW
jgi:hypothetical protein